MSRPKRSDAPPVGYPQGRKSVSFVDLEEDDWWALLHALEVRIRYFEQQRAGMERFEDPGLQRQIEHYDETIARLNGLLQSAQRQIGPGFFSRRSTPPSS
jgi:hypothetical protein